MKKLLSTITITITIALILTACSSQETNRTSPEALENHDLSQEEMFFKIGQIEREMLDKSKTLALEDDVYLETDDFIIRKSMIEARTEQSDISGLLRGDSEETSVKYQLKHETLYAEAIKQGFTVTEEEVRNLLNSEIENSRNSVNFDEVTKPFLEGMRKTLEEYWETQYDMRKQEIVISKYYDSLRETFYFENGYENYDETLKEVFDSGRFTENHFPGEEELFQTHIEISKYAEQAEEAWQKSFDKLVDNLIAKQNIRYSVNSSFRISN